MPMPPPALPALPPAPNPATSSTEFDSTAYTWSEALPAHNTAVAAIGATAYANALESQQSAATALAQAEAAVAATSAALWVSGTNYAAGAGVYSPSTLASYRTAVSGISTIDPANDPARWTRLGSPSVPDFIIQSYGVI